MTTCSGDPSLDLHATLVPLYGRSVGGKCRTHALSYPNESGSRGPSFRVGSLPRESLEPGRKQCVWVAKTRTAAANPVRLAVQPPAPGGRFSAGAAPLRPAYSWRYLQMRI